MISEEKFKEINDACDIVDLVSNYVKLEKKGSNYMGLCPFHDEKTPSFSVSPTKKLAYCMGCKKGGSPIKFLQEIENIPYMEAAKKLADKYSISLDYKMPAKKSQENQNLYDITNFSMKFYKLNLNESKNGIEALNYLHKRGLTDETINIFNIGLSPNNRSSLYEALNLKGFNEIDMLESGMIKKQDSYYDLFQNRIMFPIYDEFNNILGFSGRIYNTNDTSKYVNSPETKIFKKGNTLFNLNNAIKEIRRLNRCILVEGQLDVISLYNAGIKEALCSMGTALTINQARLIKKYTNNVVLAYDGDNAGQNATTKAIDILKKAGLTVLIVRFEDGLDPDEYLRTYGKEKLLELFSNPIDLYDFLYLDSFRNKDISNINHLELIKSKVFEIIKSSNSSILKEKFIRRLSTDFNVSYEALISDYSKYDTINVIKKNVEKKEVKKNKFNRYDKAIANLIILGMNSKEDLEIILEELRDCNLIDSRIFLLDILKLYYDKTNTTSIKKDEFENFLQSEKSYIEFINPFMELPPERITSKTKKEDLRKDSINSFKKYGDDQKIQDLSNDFYNCEDINKKIKILSEITDIKKSTNQRKD